MKRLWLAALALSSTALAQNSYKTPRTPWGDPDLQGIWPGNMGVPMQRPLALGERTTLTDEEYAKKVAQSKQQAQADAESTAASDTKAGIGPPSYWTERGKPTRQTSLIIDPPNGRLPPLTAEAEKYRKEAHLPGAWSGKADSWEDLNIYYRCISRGLLGSVIPVVYNNGNQILQAPGYVVFRNEMIHESRVIPLDGRPHVGNFIRMYMGDSRGHWEGDTLVVETTNFNDKVAFRGASENMKVIERFTRLSDDEIQYEFTVHDPSTWEIPWKGIMPFVKINGPVFEHACHEGNYGIANTLAAVRLDEKKAAEEAAKKGAK